MTLRGISGTYGRVLVVLVVFDLFIFFIVFLFHVVCVLLWVSPQPVPPSCVFCSKTKPPPCIITTHEFPSQTFDTCEPSLRENPNEKATFRVQPWASPRPHI